MTPQEPAMGVSDEAVRAAWMAFTGRDLLGPAYADDADHMAEDERRDMHAALLAALPHMQPAGEAVAYDEWRIGDERIKLVAANLQLAADLATSQDNLRMAHLALESAQSRAATPPQPSAEPQQEAVTFMVDDVKFYVPASIAEKVADRLAPRDNLPQQEAQGAEESPPCSTHPDALVLAARLAGVCMERDGLSAQVKQLTTRLAESEARAEGLVKLLREVSDWIDNWEPNFADDAEWQPVAERITAAIAQEAEREAAAA